MAERLQKVLARAGLGSRREIEDWIRAGRIQVNDAPATLGQSIDARDQVRIDGRVVTLTGPATENPRTLIYHKPAGELTTRHDEAGRPTVFDHLPRLRQARWISIGRLDFNTSGLLLLTTDGELAHRLMHPSWQIEREYAVRVLGRVDDAVLARLLEGVQLEDGMAAFSSIREAGGQGANHWYHVIVREGRNREVRRLWESQGVQVSRLIRVRYGPVSLPAALRAGRHRAPEAAELAALYAAVKLPVPEAQDKAASQRRTARPATRKATTPRARPAATRRSPGTGTSSGGAAARKAKADTGKSRTGSRAAAVSRGDSRRAAGVVKAKSGAGKSRPGTRSAAVSPGENKRTAGTRKVKTESGKSRPGSRAAASSRTSRTSAGVRQRPPRKPR